MYHCQRLQELWDSVIPASVTLLGAAALLSGEKKTVKELRKVIKTAMTSWVKLSYHL